MGTVSDDVLRAKSAIQLRRQCVDTWPKLAWVASCPNVKEPDFQVLHGPKVEHGDGWIVEAVWAGDFEEGSFDQSDLVFGSGIRVRDEHVVFVSSATPVDRLWRFEADGGCIVSNSLPALLSVSQDELLPDFDYPQHLATIRYGLQKFDADIPTQKGVIQLTHYHNLVLDGGVWTEVKKKSSTPDFPNYEAYRDYLFETARRLGENSRDSLRQFPVDHLTPISSGYDSSMTAVVAREAGCTKAATITKSRPNHTQRQYWAQPDSGAPLAERLGMKCQSVSSIRGDLPETHEEALWSQASRNVMDANFAYWEYPESPSVVYTGVCGDIVWKRARNYCPGLFERTDLSLSGLGEFRLHEGFFHAPVTFWGVDKREQISELSFAAEMEPWCLNNDYDRPIPRRMVEEVGAPRDSFGMRKSLTAPTGYEPQPHLASLQPSFRSYLEELGIRPSTKLSAKLNLAGRALQRVFFDRIPFLKWLRADRWYELPSANIFFRWSNHKLAERYFAAASN